MKGQRGFVVAEMLLAIGLFVGLGIAALSVVVMLNHVLRAQGNVTSSIATLDQEADRMRSDAASAYAVYVPFTDVFGKPNALQGQPGHEVAFLTRDSQNRDLSWAYEYDAAKQTLQRYDFNDQGSVGVRNALTGVIDPRASYSPITHVSNFSARTFEVADLVKAANPYASVLQTVVTQSTSPLVAEPVGILRNGDQPSPDLYGGNTIVQVNITTDTRSRTIHLATSAFPSGFTVHQKATFRVYVYSEKYTTASGLFDTFHISWQNVYAQLVYSFHPETDAPSAWKRWCDFNLYKLKPNGADKGGLYVNYVPDRYPETVYALYADVANASLPDAAEDKPCPVAPGVGKPQL